nr:leucine-rich repeat, cysteine-containing subtype [Tanacetum cinerariifolium]
MAPTTRQATKTKVGEEVLDLVIPYIHNVDDRSSVSLVSYNFYEVEGITRKHLTVHVHYYPNPACLSKRFPFIESLTLKGPPPDFSQTHYDPDIRITPWIEQLALEFRCSKELCIHRLVVHDEDLETLARTRGKDFRSLKIKKCKGFSTYGLMHVSKVYHEQRHIRSETMYKGMLHPLFKYFWPSNSGSNPATERHASCIFVFKRSIKLSSVTQYKNSPTHQAFDQQAFAYKALRMQVSKTDQQ